MFLSAPKPLATPRGHFTYREGGDANGTPLVMIHGWPESSYCWEHLGAYLKPGLRVIAPDLRGLGDSERTEGQQHYLKQELANDVVSMLDELGITDFQLVGHDWGGVVAQEVALAIPDRVRKMVIMNIAIINNLKGNQEVMAKVRSGSGKAYWYQHFQQAPGMAEAMIPGNEDVWLRFFLTGVVAPMPEDAIAEYIRMYSIPGTPGAGASYYRAFHDDAKRWASLSGHVWKIPSLYIYGNKDKVIIPEYLNRIEECFEDIRVEQVDAGHFLQEEKPEEVAGHMNNFFDTGH
ncbi:alpha/beta hydrolase [uncultured Marinobacter sp.]|uniref:alpha/beta fold hydrolase n=1 Tax=uncultured Marinobacter sp. TaxID=187379 RepID=UPI0030D95956